MERDGKIFAVMLALVFALYAPLFVFGQSVCSPVEVKEAVVNGDFEQGEVGFSIQPGYTKVPIGSYSNPKMYQVATNAMPNDATKSTFNSPSFDKIYDHTQPGGSNGMFLMIDADNTSGTIAWQTDIDITPNQLYYFSAWVTSLFDSNFPDLQFEISGGDDDSFAPLGARFSPNAKGVWVQKSGTWNSGSYTKATIRIVDYNSVNQNGNDFGLDDISFINGCDKISTGPQPSLGGPFSLCNLGGSVTLDSKVTPGSGIQYSWITLPSGNPVGGNTDKITVTTPGTYKVCVTQGAGCAKSSTVVVNTDLKVELGPAITLCDPPSVTLNTNLMAANSLSFKWFKDGSEIAGQTASTLNVTAAGTYKVRVHSSLSYCDDVEDDIVVSTKIATPVAGTFCSDNATFKVTGTGKYAWYTTSTGGTRQGTIGNTVSMPMTAFPANATSITMYADDTTLVSYPSTAAPIASSTSGQFGRGQSDRYIRFDVYKELILDKVTIRAMFYNSGDRDQQSSVQITGPNGYNVKKTITIPNPKTGSNATTDVIVNLGFRIPVGADYRITLNNDPGSGYDGINASLIDGNNTAYPYNPIAGIISLKKYNADPNTTYQPYYSFFDWKVLVPLGCARTPVTLTKDCPPCTTPTSLTIKNGITSLTDGDSVKLCQGTPLTLNLSAAWTAASTGALDKKFELYVINPSGTETVLATVADGSTLTSTAGQFTLTAGASLPSASGKYVIGIRNTTTCKLEQTVVVRIDAKPVLQITNPSVVCYGKPTSLTAASITSGSSNVKGLEYFSDALLNGKLTNTQASAVPTSSKTYYIKATNGLCADTDKVVLDTIINPAIKTGTLKLECSPIAGENKFRIVFEGQYGDANTYKVVAKTSDNSILSGTFNGTVWTSAYINETLTAEFSFTDVNECKPLIHQNLNKVCSCPESAVITASKSTICDQGGTSSDTTTELKVTFTPSTGTYKFNIEDQNGNVIASKTGYAGSTPFTINSNKAGTYKVTGFEGLCQGSTNSVTVGYHPSPGASISTTNANFCNDTKDEANIQIAITHPTNPSYILVLRGSVDNTDIPVSLSGNSSVYASKKAQIYTIKSVLDGNGCAAKASDLTSSVTTVAISPPVAKIMDPNSSPRLISIDQYTLVAQPIAVGNTGTWVKLVSTQQGAIASPNTNSTLLSGLSSAEEEGVGKGTTELSWTVKDNTGECKDSTANVTIIRKRSTVPNAGGPDTLCASMLPKTYSGNGNSSQGAPTETYQWKDLNLPQVAVINGNDLTVPVGTPAGVYQFEFSIYNNVADKTLLDTLYVKIDATVTVGFPVNPISTCADQVALKATPIPIGAGTWAIKNGQGSIPISDIHVVSALLEGLDAQGQTIVTWTVINGKCSSASDLIVNQVGNMTNSAVSLTGNPIYGGGKDITDKITDTLCIGSTYKLTATTPSTDPSKGESATWQNVSGSITVTSPTNNALDFIPSTMGTSVLRWIISSDIPGCNPDTATVTLIVRDKPSITSLTAPAPCEDDNVNQTRISLAYASSLNNPSFSWALVSAGTASATLLKNNGNSVDFINFKSTASSGASDSITVKATVQNTCGVEDKTQKIGFRLRPRKLVGDITGPASVCETSNLPASYTLASQNNTDEYRWYWNLSPLPLAEKTNTVTLQPADGFHLQESQFI